MFFIIVFSVVILITMISIIATIMVTIKKNKAIKETHIMTTNAKVKENKITKLTKTTSKNKNNRGNTLKFYGYSPNEGIEIESDKAIMYDIDKIVSFAEQMHDNYIYNFFVLENNKGEVIQFLNDGKSETIKLDIPIPEKQGSYEKIIINIEEVKEIVTLFSDGDDILNKYDLSFNIW